MATVDRWGANGLLYGGDYNPEQWPEHVWPEDIRLMRRAGVNFATVGVFAWARLEPRPGERDFGWLDRVLDLLHDGGVRAILATPTASPPPWLGHRHPETLPVDERGQVYTYGARNQFCPAAPAYRRYALDLVSALAQRYANHPALALWHVGNESGPICYCDATAEEFRRWLAARYGDLAGLNEAWGTTVWSQHYDTWAEVLPPRQAPYLRNPSQLLDFARFSSDLLLDVFRAERDVLRRYAPGTPVTTNFIALSRQVDQWAWAAEQDVVAIDSYPDPEDPETVIRAAFGYDLARSLRGGQPWLLMEQAAGAVSWRPVNVPKAPGLMRLWSLQAVARGADAVGFFQWRASRFGAERFHSAMLPHAGPDTRVHREVRRLGEELVRLAAVAGSRVDAEVAFVFDWPNWWALHGDAHPSSALDLLDLVTAYYRPLWTAGVTVDVVRPDDDLAGYRLVIAPNLYLTEETVAANLTGYVRAGGTAVVGFFSGVVDGRDHVRTGGHPAAALGELLGVRGEEFWPLPEGATIACESAELGSFTGTLWAEQLSARGARVVAEAVDGELAGVPVVTQHRYGAGSAWYVATRPSPEAMSALLHRVCGDASVAPVLGGLPPDVEAVRRGDVLFLLNHGSGGVRVELGRSYRDLLTGALHAGWVVLDRYAVVALSVA